MSPDLDTTDAGTPEPGTPEPGTPRHSRTKQWVAAAAVAGALLGTTGIAMAQTSDSGSGNGSTTTEQAPPDQVDRSQAVHPGEELLTGETAEKVAAAAQAAVSDATIDRVETDAEGSPYEAHMTKSDGSHVTVKVDESFSVTSVENDQGPPAGMGRAPVTPSGSQSTGSA